MILPIILSVLLIIALVFSISVIIAKRKKAGSRGIRSALTPICLCLIAVINLLAYWLGFLGILSWSITMLLLLLGAFFTKYIPISKNVT